jgi:hypothetical protein
MIEVALTALRQTYDEREDDTLYKNCTEESTQLFMIHGIDWVQLWISKLAGDRSAMHGKSLSVARRSAILRPEMPRRS